MRALSVLLSCVSCSCCNEWRVSPYCCCCCWVAPPLTPCLQTPWPPQRSAGPGWCPAQWAHHTQWLHAGLLSCHPWPVHSTTQHSMTPHSTAERWSVSCSTSPDTAQHLQTRLHQTHTAACKLLLPQTHRHPPYLDRLCPWPNEDDALLSTAARKGGVLRQETVPWVYGVHLGLLGHLDDGLNVQVAGHRLHVGRAHAVGLVRVVAVGEQPVCGAIDGNLCACVYKA